MGIDLAEIENRLVHVFSQYSTAEDDALRRAIRNEVGDTKTLLRVNGYKELLNRIQLVHRDLEMVLRACGTAEQKEQNIGCILNGFVTYSTTGAVDLREKMRLMSRLVKAMLRVSGTWSEAQHRHFDCVVDWLQEWDQYFLSYTGRDPKIINDRYQKCIKAALSIDDSVFKKERSHSNLLARALVRSLTSQNLRRVFFDQHSDLGVGERLDSALNQRAGRCFAFVQLVQLETFGSAEVNWCFLEYCDFSNHAQHEAAQNPHCAPSLLGRVIPVLCGGDEEIVPHVVMPEHVDWRNHLVPTRAHGAIRRIRLSRDPEQYRRDTREIARSIFDIMNRIAESVPKN
jgi:hypothetical protein